MVRHAFGGAWLVLFLAASSGIAFADVLHLKDGKVHKGTVQKDLPDAVEFDPETGKGFTVAKSKIARITRCSSKTPAPDQALPGTADGKLVVYEDLSVGASLECPPRWTLSVESSVGRLVLRAKADADGAIHLRAWHTLRPVAEVAAAIKEEEEVQLGSAAWKEETGAPEGGLACSIEFTREKTKLRRDYRFLPFNGRVLVACVEVPAARAKTLWPRLEPALASIRPVSCEPYSRVEGGEFFLVRPPVQGFASVGLKPFSMKNGGLDGKQFTWIGGEGSLITLGVFRGTLPDDLSGLRSLASKEFTQFANVQETRSETIKLGGLDAQLVDFTAVFEGEKTQDHQACMFRDGDALYTVQIFFGEKSTDAKKRAFDHFLAVLRTPGMKE